MIWRSIPGWYFSSPTEDVKTTLIKRKLGASEELFLKDMSVVGVDLLKLRSLWLLLKFGSNKDTIVQVG
jgi:hypothetical protein